MPRHKAWLWGIGGVLLGGVVLTIVAYGPGGATTPSGALQTQLKTVVMTALRLEGSINTIPTSDVALDTNLSEQKATGFIARGEHDLLTVFSSSCPFYRKLTSGLQAAVAASRTDRQLGYGISEFRVTSERLVGESATVNWQAQVWFTSTQKKPDGTWTTPFRAKNGLIGVATLHRRKGFWVVVDWGTRFLSGQAP